MSKLFVICGHGAGDPGACGNGYQEAERVRALGKRIKELGGNHVILGDMSRNYYADNGISNLTISKDDQIILSLFELLCQSILKFRVQFYQCFY